MFDREINSSQSYKSVYMLTELCCLESAFLIGEIKTLYSHAHVQVLMDINPSCFRWMYYRINGELNVDFHRKDELDAIYEKYKEF